jgi:NADPH:quinone reductase-like Zn-dependent oxidoreductase
MMDLSPETIPEKHVSQKENIIKAIVGDTYGSPDVLELRDIDKPEISDDEVLVRVHTAGVDRGVWHLMTGLPYVARLALGLRAPKNPVPGMDVAGVVEALGGSVTRFQPGDEVFGIGKGAFAEHARAPEHKLVHKPASLTFEQAAVLAISSLTALQGLRDHGKVESGQEVLIIGASGGVGTCAVQIARAFGARVTGVCGTARVEMVHRRGSRHRQDVPARRGPRGHPLSRRRTGQRKSRHQRVTVNRA